MKHFYHVFILNIRIDSNNYLFNDRTQSIKNGEFIVFILVANQTDKLFEETDSIFHDIIMKERSLCYQ